LDKHSRIKYPRLSIDIRQSLVAQIARLENLKDLVRERFVHEDAEYSVGLRWRAIDTAFENRVLTGAVINSKHIESRQFFEDAREIVLNHVQDVLRKHDALKINTVMNLWRLTKVRIKILPQETMNSFKHRICMSGTSYALSSLR